VNLLLDNFGANAQIALDGRNVTQINTYANRTHGPDCHIVSWTSESSDYGDHVLTVTNLATGTGAMDKNFLLFHSFQYSSDDQPKKHSHIGVIMGVTVGGVVALSLIIIAIIILLRRRKQQSAKVDDEKKVMPMYTPRKSAASVASSMSDLSLKGKPLTTS